MRTLKGAERTECDFQAVFNLRLKPVFRSVRAVVTVVALSLLNRLPNGTSKKPERMAGVYTTNNCLKENQPCSTQETYTTVKRLVNIISNLKGNV